MCQIIQFSQIHLLQQVFIDILYYISHISEFLSIASFKSQKMNFKTAKVSERWGMYS